MYSLELFSPRINGFFSRINFEKYVLGPTQGLCVIIVCHPSLYQHNQYCTNSKIRAVSLNLKLMTEAISQNLGEIAKIVIGLKPHSTAFRFFRFCGMLISQPRFATSLPPRYICLKFGFPVSSTVYKWHIVIVFLWQQNQYLRLHWISPPPHTLWTFFDSPTNSISKILLILFYLSTIVKFQEWWIHIRWERSAINPERSEM